MLRKLFLLLLLCPAPAPAQWERIDQNIGLTASDIIHLPVQQSGYVFVTALVNGREMYMYRSADDGITWSRLTNFPAYRLPPNFFMSVKGRLIVGALPGDGSAALFAYSDDNGENWSEISAPGVGSPRRVAKVGDDYFACTANLVARSTDDGQTWHNLPDSPLGASSLVEFGGNLFSNSSVGFNHRSSDRGATWEQVSLDGSTTLITGMWHDGERIYAKRSAGAIYSSTNGGLSWTEMPTFDIFAFLTVATTPSGDVWLPYTITGGPVLIYESTDKGAGATPLTEGYPTNTLGAPCTPNPAVNERYIFITAGCFNDNSGMYRYRHSGGSTSSVAHSAAGRLALEPPYPNPLADMCTLYYSLEKAAHVRLAVVDVLGREVLRFEEGMRGPGRHAFGLELDKLAPGHYFLRLQAGGHNAGTSIVVQP